VPAPFAEFLDEFPGRKLTVLRGQHVGAFGRDELGRGDVDGYPDVLARAQARPLDAADEQVERRAVR
jgi:hypothetical protein